MARKDEHRECYRRCFSTPDGQKVLGHMLIEMGYFDTKTDAPQLREYAAGLLRTLGFTDTPYKIEQLVARMFTITQE